MEMEMTFVDFSRSRRIEAGCITMQTTIAKQHLKQQHSIAESRLLAIQTNF